MGRDDGEVGCGEVMRMVGKVMGVCVWGKGDGEGGVEVRGDGEGMMGRVGCWKGDGEG